MFVGVRSFLRATVQALSAAGLLLAFPGQVRATPQDLAERIEVEIDAGRYDRAEQLARELDREPAPGGSLPASKRHSRDLLVRTLILNGYASRPETLALANEALSAEPSGPPFPNCCELKVLNFADALAGTSDYESASRVLQEALATSRVSLDSGPGLRADFIEHLAKIQLLADDTAKAVASSEQAVTLRRASPSASPASLASALLVSGWALQRAGQYGPAGTAIREAVGIYSRSAPIHPAYAEALSLLSLQLWFEGSLRDAYGMSEDALRLAEQTLRADHPTIALALKRLAINKLFLGDTADARALLQRALEIASRTFPPDHIEMWSYLNDLADAERTSGDYGAARPLFERARQIAERKFGRWHDSVATSLHNLALVDASLGDYARAQVEQLRATETWERVLGRGHPFVAVALIELAAVYRSNGAPDLALPILQRALSIRQQRLGQQHRDVAKAWTDLAATQLSLGRPTAAMTAVTRALAVWSSTDGAETPEMAATYRLSAAIQARRGYATTARELYTRSLDILRKSLGPSHPVFAETQGELATVLLSLGEHTEAVRTATDAELTGQAHLRLMLQSVSEREALNYARRRPQALDILLTEASTLPQAASVAFDALVRGRALVLDEMSARRASGQLGPTTAVSLSKISAARQRLANLIVKGPDALSIAQYTELVDHAREAVDELESQLAVDSSPYRAQFSRSRIGLTDIRRALPPHTALVSYVRYGRLATTGRSRIPSYMAFIVYADSTEPMVVSLGSAQLVDGLVRAWRRSVSTPPHTDALAEALLRPRVGVALRKRIWDPVAKAVNNAARVFIVPDGSINVLPFAALPTTPGHYVIESAPTLHYLAAERDVVSAAQIPRDRTRALLTVGGAAFDGGRSLTLSEARGAPNSDRLPPVARIRNLAGCASLQTMKFEELPGTRREAEAVADLWRRFGYGATENAIVDTLVGVEATETAFKALSPGHEVLHVASHGFVMSDDCTKAVAGTRSVGKLVSAQTSPPSQGRPSRRMAFPAGSSPLLRSGLAFAGANRRATTAPDEDDGILTAAEVAGVNLEGTAWVVLSACDTGLGTASSGEGVLGLRRSFQIAGARTVIMSLWSVQDQATVGWMQALYSARLERSLDTADSVKEAGVTVLRERRAKGLDTNPFYWAGFVAAGDWH